MFSDFFSQANLMTMACNALLTLIIGFMIITGQQKAH